MKKSLKIVALLLMVAVFSVCGISSTFAKYTTSANVTKSATVAKFGVTVTASSTLANTYGGGNVTGISSSNLVVAPGTSGTLAQVTITGTPEVKTNVSYTVTTFSLSGWTTKIGEETTETDYLPLSLKLIAAGTTYTYAVGGDNTELTYNHVDADPTHDIQEHEEFTGSISQIESAIKAKIASLNADSAANSDYSHPATPGTGLTSVNKDFSLTWNWAAGSDATTNARDTYLAGKNTAPSISINITCTVNQVVA